jgi:hypothetical protein
MVVEYIEPNVIVTQTFLEEAPIIGPTELATCIIGPLYKILRFEESGEFDYDDGTGTAANETYTIELPDDAVLYNGSVTVYLKGSDNAWHELDPGAGAPVSVDYGVGTITIGDWDDIALTGTTINLLDDQGVVIDTWDPAAVGAGTNSAAATVAITAKALRKDVSTLLEVTTLDDLETLYGPVIPENTLVWGMKFALLNSNTRVFGKAVYPEAADLTQETIDTDDYFRAFEEIEAQDVYSLVPVFPEKLDATSGEYIFDNDIFDTGLDYAAPAATDHVFENIATVNQYIKQHADEMSTRECQRERIATSIVPIYYDEANRLATDIVDQLAAHTVAFSDRRFYLSIPYKVKVDVEGTSTWVSAQIINCGTAGLDAAQAPAQGFTNFPINGFTALRGSNDYFSNAQLNEIAAGGTYIYDQEQTGTPVSSRHQMSTNRLTVERAERSITKQIDYCTKIYRREMKPYVGLYNISENFLAKTAAVLQGIGEWLTGRGVVRGTQVVDHKQDPNNPDTVLSKIRVFPYYPANYFDIELLI